MAPHFHQMDRWPVLAIIGAAVLALSLFAPLPLLTTPLLVALGFAIASNIRKERPTRLPYGVGGVAILFLILVRFHERPGLIEPEKVNASAMFGDGSWEYGQAKDEMRGTVTKTASLNSATELNLAAPYDGTNAASISVSDAPGIMLSVWKGQFMCNSDTMVAMKIDQGPVFSYPCSSSENGQTNHIFIDQKTDPAPEQPSDPLVLLTRGKRLTIEADFYSAGKRQIIFNITGFIPEKLK